MAQRQKADPQELICWFLEYFAEQTGQAAADYVRVIRGPLLGTVGQVAVNAVQMLLNGAAQEDRPLDDCVVEFARKFDREIENLWAQPGFPGAGVYPGALHAAAGANKRSKQLGPLAPVIPINKGARYRERPWPV